MSELAQEFARMNAKYKELNKQFNSDEEALEYYERQARELTEEEKIIFDRIYKYTIILDSYNEYTENYKDYILERFYDYRAFVLIQSIVLTVSLILIIFIPILLGKLIVSIFVLIILIYNLSILIKIQLNRRKVKKNLLDKYNINVSELTEEEVDEMSLMALQNRMRGNDLCDRIVEFNYFSNLKMIDITAKKNKDKEKNKDKK